MKFLGKIVDNKDLVNKEYIYDKFLPLVGGKMTGSITFTDNQGINIGDNTYTMLRHDGVNTVVGPLKGITSIRSGTNDLIHIKSGTGNFKIWDASNLNPSNYQPVGDYVTIANDETITGSKTFTDNLKITASDYIPKLTFERPTLIGWQIKTGGSGDANFYIGTVDKDGNNFTNKLKLDWSKNTLSGPDQFTGNASTATKLQTPRTLWGQSFDGTANVTGLIKADSGVQIGDTVGKGWYLSAANRLSTTQTTQTEIAHGINIGDLLVSNLWDDYTKVPTNGAYIKGDIISDGNLTVAGNSKLTGNVGIGVDPSTSYALNVNGNTVLKGSVLEGMAILAYNYAHAEGFNTSASGEKAHAEGNWTTANGIGSHTEGNGTIANNNFEYAGGVFNISHINTNVSIEESSKYNTLHSIGIGTSDTSRKNAFEITGLGNVYINGVGGYKGDETNYQFKVRIDNGTIKSVQDEINNKLYKDRDGIINGSLKVNALTSTGKITCSHIASDGELYANGGNNKVWHTGNAGVHGTNWICDDLNCYNILSNTVKTNTINLEIDNNSKYIPGQINRYNSALYIQRNSINQNTIINWDNDNTNIGKVGIGILAPLTKLDICPPNTSMAALRIISSDLKPDQTGSIFSWDAENNALKIEGNIYATGQISAGGIGESESGGAGFIFHGPWADYAQNTHSTWSLGADLGKTMYEDIESLKKGGSLNQLTIKAGTVEAIKTNNGKTFTLPAYPTTLPANGGNADTLDNHDSTYFATKSDLNSYLPLSGGIMSGDISIPNGYYLYGKNENGGSIIHFDGTRTVIGSIGAASTAATHVRSKTGHMTIGTGSIATYNILDSGNTKWGTATDNYIPLTINSSTAKNISLNGHTHAWTDISSKPLYSWSGDSDLNILKANVTSAQRNTLIGAYLSHGSAAYAMGWVLSGYDSSPYAAFLVNNYGNNWSVIGSSAGSWSEATLWHSGNLQKSEFAKASHGNHVPMTETANNARYLRNDNTWQTISPNDIGAQPAGNYIRATKSGSYWGLTLPDNGVSDWIRTTVYGIIPYSSDTTSGSSSIGTSDWPFSAIHAKTFYGYLSGNAASATKLTSSAGGTTTPIYFSGGKPVACDYSLGSMCNQSKDDYLLKSGGTMTGQIKEEGKSTSYYAGRDVALTRLSTYTGYGPITSIKSPNGDWSMGVYSDDSLKFVYVKDSDYNTNNNNWKLLEFNTDGTINTPGGITATGNLTVSGTSKLTGNVGIGINPSTSYALTVNGNFYSKGTIISGASEANNTGFFYGSDDATMKLYSVPSGCPECGSPNEGIAIQTNFDGVDPLDEQSTYPINYPRRATFSLQPRGGYVGIGTTVPKAKLDIFIDNTTGYEESVSNKALRIFNKTGENKGQSGSIFSWDAENNALKIEGNIYATGQISAGGIGESSSRGGDVLHKWSDYDDNPDSHASWSLGADLGAGLRTRINALERGGSLDQLKINIGGVPQTNNNGTFNLPAYPTKLSELSTDINNQRVSTDDINIWNSKASQNDIDKTVFNYLPLSGGKITGPISFSNETAIPSGTLSYITGISAISNGQLQYESASAFVNRYAPTKTGTGASGTWSINITGSAGSAGSADSLSSKNIGNTNTPVFINNEGKPEVCDLSGLTGNYIGAVNRTEANTWGMGSPSGSTKIWVALPEYGLIPYANNTGRLGLPTNRFLELYIYDIYANGSVNANDVYANDFVYALNDLVSDGNLTVALDSFFGGDINTDSNIIAKGEVTAHTASDRRLKKNIQTITSEEADKILTELNPVEFEWNETMEKLSTESRGVARSFIADEFLKVLPNAGDKIWDKYDAIKIEQVIPYLVAGYKSQKDQINKQEKQIEELTNMVKNLMSVVNKLNGGE